jgi:hypothetical protein
MIARYIGYTTRSAFRNGTADPTGSTNIYSNTTECMVESAGIYIYIYIYIYTMIKLKTIHHQPNPTAGPPHATGLHWLSHGVSVHRNEKVVLCNKERTYGKGYLRIFPATFFDGWMGWVGSRDTGVCANTKERFPMFRNVSG